MTRPCVGIALFPHMTHAGATMWYCPMSRRAVGEKFGVVYQYSFIEVSLVCFLS
jgi:hypothetical protein